MSEDVLIERRGAVTLVTMNRPERLNAFSLELRSRLGDALESEMANESCRALVLTGAGGNFCAGGDLRSMRPGDALFARQRLAAAHRVVRLLAAGTKPVVAAVEGAAFGAGLSLAVCCDQVVAAEDARFGAAFIHVGLLADMGLFWALPQRIGLGRAKRLLYLGETLEAPEAGRLGLVDELAPPGEALTAALALAERLAAVAPVALAMTKSAFARGPATLEEVLALEADGQTLLMGTADHAEGRAAFLEKRKPSFTGR